MAHPSGDQRDPEPVPVRAKDPVAPHSGPIPSLRWNMGSRSEADEDLASQDSRDSASHLRGDVYSPHRGGSCVKQPTTNST